MASLSPEEAVRYRRQMVLPEIGRKGQQKLKDARVFIAGLGGLGSVSSLYLAAAGVGYLQIVDMDRVAPENLNRQILHSTQDLGRPKTDSAIEKLKALNPFCRVNAVQAAIRSDTIDDLVEDCGMILDAVDNFETRVILNRISLSRGIPFVFGGVNGFDGMTTTFIPGKTPCFECLFPKPPVTRDSSGIIGPLPAVIAGIQSLEAVKLILGIPGLLAGRLLTVRGANMTFKEIRMKKNPDCTICGPNRETLPDG